MKLKLILTTILLLSSFSAFAGRFGIDLGTGPRSPYGLLGIGIRYLPTERFDLHYNSSAGVIGKFNIIGTRLYTGPMSNKCFYFIPCVAVYYASAYYGSSDGGTVTAKDGAIESDYEFTSSDFTGISVGFFDLFGGWFYYSVDVGYRSYGKVPKLELVSGPQNTDAQEDLNQYTESGVTYSLSLGVLF